MCVGKQKNNTHAQTWAVLDANKLPSRNVSGVSQTQNTCPANSC